MKQICKGFILVALIVCMVTLTTPVGVFAAHGHSDACYCGTKHNHTTECDGVVGYCDGKMTSFLDTQKEDVYCGTFNNTVYECTSCFVTGYEGGTHYVTCDSCNGSGGSSGSHNFVLVDSGSSSGNQHMKESCMKYEKTLSWDKYSCTGCGLSYYNRYSSCSCGMSSSVSGRASSVEHDDATVDTSGTCYSTCSNCGGDGEVYHGTFTDERHYCSGYCGTSGTYNTSHYKLGDVSYYACAKCSKGRSSSYYSTCGLEVIGLVCGKSDSKWYLNGVEDTAICNKVVTAISFK